MIRGKEAAEKWAKVLDLPEDQAIPCVVAFVCLRYHGKSFVRKIAEGPKEPPFWKTIWITLKIQAALFRWGLAVNKDTWGELYRITKFAQKWKEGDSI